MLPGVMGVGACIGGKRITRGKISQRALKAAN